MSEPSSVAVRRESDDAEKADVVGLIPAGGRATRIAPLPCSKEIYPIGFRHVEGERSSRPKVACHYLLEQMRGAGITKAYMVIREGKWDIPAYLGSGALADVNLAYIVLSSSCGAPDTLDKAYPYVAHARVAFGFPDIVFQSADGFACLLARQTQSKPSLVLGLFPADKTAQVDMVHWLTTTGRVREIVIKPQQTRLTHSWCIAVWTPVFTQFLHEFVEAHGRVAANPPELSMGQIIQAAIESGMEVQAVPVSEQPYIDIGTPDGLARSITRHMP